MVMSYELVLLDEKLQKIRDFKLKELDESIVFVPSYGQDKDNPDGYLLGCGVKRGTQKSKNFYEGSRNEKSATWLVKACLNNQNHEIQLIDPALNSLFLDKEEVHGILEYAANKIILFAFPKDLLIVHDYQVVKRIQESNVGNV